MNPLILPLLASAILGFALLKKGGPSASAPHRRALVIGDSHSEAPWTFGGRINAMLQGRGLISDVEGNRGWSVRRYLNTGALISALTKQRPDLLVVALGANDQVSDAQSDSYKRSLREFLNYARGAGVREVVWFGPSKSEGSQAHRMPTRRRVARLQMEVLRDPQTKNLYRPMKISWVDSMPLTADLPTRDGVHMGPSEYQTPASRAAPSLSLV